MDSQQLLEENIQSQDQQQQSPFLQFISNAAIFVAILFFIIMTLLYFFQNKILYMPTVQGLPKSHTQNPAGYRNPGDRGIDYNDIHITTSDNIRLHGWICKQKNSKQVPTLIYFHENAGNIGTRVFYMEEYYKTGANIVLVAYRGYSDSEGEPTEQGIQLDSQAVLKHIFNREDLDNKQIFLHGRSLGGAVSIYAAATFQNEFKLAGVIVENTFTSIGAMVDVVFPKLAFMKPLLLKNNWQSIERVDKIKVPMHFIFAMKDELVPPKHMAELFDKANQVAFKSKHIVQEGNHNNSWTIDVETYFNSIRQFMEKSLKQQQLQQ